jgi:FAD/FMN-containing dehydrogenase/Fe-S oxidoreductase
MDRHGNHHRTLWPRIYHARQLVHLITKQTVSQTTQQFNNSTTQQLNIMPPSPSVFPFENLESQLDGDLFYDIKWRMLYATDASVYRELPAAVCRPKHEQDMGVILSFCREHKLPIIPRAAGTSLAGQVVGPGMVVDVSKYMNNILEVNETEKWVRVQPGVILDELNDFLKPYGLFFGPETSTSNRCMIGGMVGNNACGSHSLVYGSTRDHTLEIRALLSDGSIATFSELDNNEFRNKCVGNKLENRIYSQLFSLLSDKKNQQEILEQYPDPRLKRRNTGYALDMLLATNVFGDDSDGFNFCKMLAGSEGSLAIFTEIKLNLVSLPPPEKALVCVHLNNINEALEANLIALDHKPVAVELIDRIVLECTKTNLLQQKNRFFLKGDPGAILVVEFAAESRQEILDAAQAMETSMRGKGLGTYFPVLFGKDISRVWALRKAGLGLLSNIPGDAKPVAVIEDTAVHVTLLPDFIREMQTILERLKLECVFYAHIGTGELHLRPVLNLKNPADVERFYQVAKETAWLVKKYRGSLSGEHGDGRLRAEFIPIILGDRVVDMMREIKHTWDPLAILNPGKIIDPPSMKSSLRYTPGQKEKKFTSFFDYPEAGSFLGAVEQCNGSGDCRKPYSQSGVMCPSYQATLNEDASTRGRANILREFISHSNEKNPFNHKQILEVLDLCLSCKACKSECPSNVDMAKYKAEALQQYYLTNGIPLRAKLTGAVARMYKLGSLLPSVFNFFAANTQTSAIIMALTGFTTKRKLPLLGEQSLKKWIKKNLNQLNRSSTLTKEIYFFCDEFTNYNDTQTGIHAILLLNKLGYKVNYIHHAESGRARISKGLLIKARKVATRNVRVFAPIVDDTKPLIGIEPSAILSFRDEYPVLVAPSDREHANILAKHVFTIDEFISTEFKRGRIDHSVFSSKPKIIYFHGHCHQKALSSTNHSLTMLSIPPNTTVKEIDCGCCGMAGSFGYEKEHYALSMAIGELKLFPAIRHADHNALIAASGTSCRMQILDGTGRHAMHPVDILYNMLKD